MSEKKQYIAIDLKSFYASVECMQRNLNPMTTLLVVADKSRTEKTICLAVSPALKSFGVGGRPRLFEVIQRVKQVNYQRQAQIANHRFKGQSSDATELALHPDYSLDFIVAPPQMAEYIRVSTVVYDVYLKYVAPEDMHVYSIDEVFIDATPYLATYGLTAKELAMKMILDVLKKTGITATAGIGSNMYLAKIAMDIEAKHQDADENGVRIAELDEMSYRQRMWTHRPLTDFWRVGKGVAKRLEAIGIYTMGDIARCSLGKANDRYNEELLYHLFGINAELLIDHAWGWEPTTIADIKAYKPSTNSLGSGQVLQDPYPFDQALLVAREMADMLALDLVEKDLVTDQMVLSVQYDIENLTDPKRRAFYKGAIAVDNYGRSVPKPVHGSINLSTPGSSSKVLMERIETLFRRIVDPTLLVRKINMACNHVVKSTTLVKTENIQLDLFGEGPITETEKKNEKDLAQEKKVQQVMLDIKKRFGKNAILKGFNLEEGATAKLRNSQIGGHKA